MKSKKSRIGAILLAMVIFAGAMSGIAFADTGQAADRPEKPDMSAIKANYDSLISKFATNLGVTEDQVKEALEATQLEMIDEAVEAGTITQEQAEQMIERIESGEDYGIMGFGMGFGGPGGHGPGPGRDGNGAGSNSVNATN
ncbi:DUF2680 domain-containing protein [Desulfocucumis palustris]|uniref:DUF2680 domain-containing protein n=1 Tax=Desulfocucumis palustris TaxID=1898651 RepID=UPI0013FE0CE0|nr:DUF2680 domain-containing protein [Desulfocucumis palustris]